MDDPLPLIVQIMSLNPSSILEVDNTIAEGRLANLFVFDPNRKWNYATNQGRSAAKNSPYEGFEMKGSVIATFANGKKVFFNRLDSISLSYDLHIGEISKSWLCHSWECFSI